MERVIKGGENILNMGEIKGYARQVVGAIKENLGWLTNVMDAKVRAGKDARVAGEPESGDLPAPQQAKSD
jgi:hypothetical protein